MDTIASDTLNSISRRRVLFGGGLLVTRGGQESGQSSERPRLAKEWQFATAPIVSPDGSLVALERVRNSTRTFRLGGWPSGRVEDRSDERVELWQTGQWKLVGSYPTSAIIKYLGFFRNSQGLLCQFIDAFRRQRQWVVLRPGAPPEVLLDEKNYVGSPSEAWFDAYDDQTLIARFIRAKSPQEWEIGHAKLGSREIIRRLSYFPDPSLDAGDRAYTGVRYSGNREYVIQTYGRIIFLRRCGDLTVVWTRLLGERASVMTSSISSGGEFIAVLQESYSVGDAPICTILVLDGKTGKTILELPSPDPLPNMASSRQLAITSDGKILAWAEDEFIRSPKSVDVMSVHLTSVPDGAEVAKLEHGVIEMQKGVLDFGFARSGFHFTPDNRYLFAGGRHTKVWDLKPGGSEQR